MGIVKKLILVVISMKYKKLMENKLKIKSAFTYYDERFSLYNLFIFLEFCGIGFCIQRLAQDPKMFSVEYMLMQPSYGNFTYIFTNKDDIPMSIHKLKKLFPTGKKRKITNKYWKYIDCLACVSCNYFVFLLNLAYEKEPAKLKTHGIYLDFEVIAIKGDSEPSKLQESLKYWEKHIIKSPDDFINKINLFVTSNYNFELFEIDTHNTIVCDYVCEQTGFECNCELDRYDKNIFHCMGCITQNSINEYFSYSLCREHFTNENIKDHITCEHDGVQVSFSSGLDCSYTQNIKPVEKTKEFVKTICKNQQRLASL